MFLLVNYTILCQNLHHFYRSLGGWTYEFLPYYLVDFTANLDNPATQMMADIIDPIGKLTFSYLTITRLIYRTATFNGCKNDNV